MHVLGVQQPGSDCAVLAGCGQGVALKSPVGQVVRTSQAKWAEATADLPDVRAPLQGTLYLIICVDLICRSDM